MDNFVDRHIGLSASDIQEMLSALGYSSLEGLISDATPEEIRAKKLGASFKAKTEAEWLNYIWKIACKNKVTKSYIGRGYYGTELPTVIQRNILENPVWLTSYTPYQPEIAQGRLTALLNFQTAIMEITEHDIANASLLDEGTACAEAVAMAYNNRASQTANKIFMDQYVFPQTKEVVYTRAKACGLEIVEGLAQEADFDKDIFCVLVQTPSSQGRVLDWGGMCQLAQSKKIITIFSADLLSLCLFKTPASQGADITVGSCQRLGLPMMFGGPHCAYIATKTQYARSLPGRIVGLSKDRHGISAKRLALQTREQHIRRERATSNICTAQALLATVVGMVAIYHGPKRLLKIALHVHTLALYFAKILKEGGWDVRHLDVFDTVQITVDKNYKLQKGLGYEYLENDKTKILSFSINQTTTKKDVDQLISTLNCYKNQSLTNAKPYQTGGKPTSSNKHLSVINKKMFRSSPCLKHPVFSMYHSETQILRYIHYLQNQDLSLAHSMIPLGSCTMKLNSTTELLPMTWSAFSNIHPFAPEEHTRGFKEVINKLEHYLCEITGFSAISFQPNAGSQGELAGLLAIKAYHQSKAREGVDSVDNNAKKTMKKALRNICLIPVSAHGTNPASAKMAGLTPVAVACDKQGNISLADLKKKIQFYKDTLAALMITYPSTSGVFEENILSIIKEVKKAKALVYLDGANMNALIGISRPAEWGIDVCHLNLHKTFCIPHGGGGPGVGPVAVTNKLKAFLPQHFILRNTSDKTRTSNAVEGYKNTIAPAVSSAPWGSAGILMISLAYIELMGSKGLAKATQAAILNANYIARKLSKHFKILYTGKKGLVAHECIIDIRKFRNTAEVTVDDIAKRLIDYGFHAPTMSWPVPGTLMIEPTESEDKQEIDRFCLALIEIRKEIKEIEDKKYSIKNNVLKNAPHVFKDAMSEKWPFPYSPQKAFYPLDWVKEHKFWSPVSRIENAYGDINLFCSCPPLSSTDLDS